MTDPPRLAIWLLTRRLSVDWCDFVVGDLEEEFATRCADSPVAARAWFWWQTMRCLAAPPPVRPNPLPVGSSPRDSTMRTLFADLRYAFRIMSRTPSFAVAVVSVLALGIGANTAIFSIVNAVLLRPLPFEEPEQLVRIFTTPGQTVDSSSSPPASSTAGSGTRSRSTAWRCINAAASGSSRSLARAPREQYRRQPSVRAFSRSSEPDRRSDASFVERRTRQAASTSSS